MRFANKTISRNLPRLQVLIYPVVEFFDLILPSYIQPIINIFHSRKGGLILELHWNKSISDDKLDNNHITIQQKKQFRPFFDANKYRQISKEPITDNIDGNPKLINKILNKY